MCQEEHLVHCTKLVYWRSLETWPGDPLLWLALSPHVQGRVPELQRVIQLAWDHACSAGMSTWAAARGITAWELGCVVACLNKTNQK